MAVRKTLGDEILRIRLAVSGTVQGVGFRPFVYQLARSLGLRGWVRNTPSGVVIEAEGPSDVLDDLVYGLKQESPPLAKVFSVRVERLPPVGYGDFEIRTSECGAEARTSVPPDIATCNECIKEVLSPDNRRYCYPFTNCTNCGPRFTIIRQIPYDRPNTTMCDFEMCEECSAEYHDPSDRRFHAQPNACPLCGPHLALDGNAAENDFGVIVQAAELLWQGKILAVKGLGGYHLACDARNSKAVRALRERKGRSAKPFALMCSDIEEVRKICEIDGISETLLLSPERPIVLLPARLGCDICKLVAPGTATLGVMLPYTPLHRLLMLESPPSLVMTSGNLSEEPIVYRDDEAKERLGRIADHFLSHNRPIHVPCDDSVTRTVEGVPTLIRRARGYAPQPIELGFEMPSVLACGADLKSTFCITKGSLAVLSQHLGDLENVASREHYARMVEHFCEFFDVQPRIVAHDLHPDYHSTRYAESVHTCSKVAVQHHHAHIASCIAENRLSGPVMGVAFDGSGWGEDGTIWGGEFLVGDLDGFERRAHLAYVPMPGGDAAIRKPARMATSYLLHTFGASGLEVAEELLTVVSPQELDAMHIQIERGVNAPLTSSIGRLFDAVSALLGICTDATYEGQAAVELESVCGETEYGYGFELLVGTRGIIEADVRPMLEEIVRDIRKRESAGVISARFHSTIARMVVEVCCELKNQTGLGSVALSGGVFQNVRLLSRTLRGLRENGFEVFRQTEVPCNDGGISLGQAVIASRRYEV